MKYNRVLITGAAGRIAKHIRERLAPQCTELRLADCVPFEAHQANETAHRVDLSLEAHIAPLVVGVDAIVHLAGYPREASWSTILPANVVAVANLWEAALHARVRRIVYATSNHAVGFYPRSQRIDGDVAPRPDSRYGVAKVFMESVASLYADKYGLTAMGIRIGHCAPEPSDARMLSHWVHPEDLADLVELGLTAAIDHEIVYGVSANSASWWDNSHAKALGYAPKHSADKFAEALRNQRSDSVIAERYQGGSFAADGYLPSP